MYPPHHLGGAEIHWQSAVESLKRDGHSVDVLTTDFRLPDADATLEDGSVRRQLRWYWHDHAFPRVSLRERIAIERHNHARFEALLDELEPDLILWWAMGGMSLGLIESGRRGGLPAVGVVVDDWMTYGPRVDAWTRLASRLPVGPVERLSGLPARIAIANAAEWIFISENVREAAASAGVRPGRSSVEHPGVDPDLFPRAADEPWRWRLLYVGRIDPRKGIEAAIRALAHLPEEASLGIWGRGDERHLDHLQSCGARPRPR